MTLVHFFRGALVFSVIFSGCGSTRSLGGARSAAMREAMRLIPAGRVERASPGGAWITEELPRFAVDRAPVSVRDYADRVASQGLAVAPADAEAGVSDALRRDHAWRGATPPERYLAHPMVAVSHREARDFCAWRGARLPTAAEWERAVYGDDRRPFPWGDGADATRTNTVEFGAGDTVPALTHPRGVGPFDVADGAGQVYEWTDTPAGEGHRVVMGSSWRDPLRPRAPGAPASRPEATRSLTLGFRCVRDVGP